MNQASKVFVVCLSIVVGTISVAEGATLKFRPATPFDPVIGRYLVTLDSSVPDDTAELSAESLAHAYVGQLEPSASSDRRTFTLTMLPSRARTLSADSRVREVAEIVQPDSHETPPAAPPRANLVSPHLVPHQLSSSGTYAYDGSGNIKGIGTDSFFYDVEGRLVDATAQGNQQTYTYDIYGNRLSATRANGAIGCLGNTTCEAAVTMSETPSTTNHLAGVSYDEAGNVTQGYDASYVYDGAGMMTKATVGTDVRNFVYTADDERIAVKQGLSWTWSVRDQGGKVLREFTSIETSNPFALSGHTWSKDYVWRDGQLLASTSIPAGYTTPITYHYHLNHLGTPRMITRDNGIVVSNHNYYPFGSEMDLTLQESPAEAMKFTGHERDIVAGSNHSVDYMHARYYNGNLGRFLEVDPVLGHPTTPQSWNRYSYVHNNPTKNVDPDGREVWVSAEMQAAVTFGNMFSPAFRAQYLQFRDDPRVYWLIRGENQAASGTRARSQPLALQLDAHGHVTHAGEISYIPRFVGVNEQAKLIAHEGGHLGEEVSTGRTVQDRYKSHENGISLNVAAGENHYESRQVLAFEQLVADELRSNTAMLPVSKPIVMNMLDLTPAQK